MIHVYRIPEKRSNGYCFAGPVPIAFGNVDWMYDPEEGVRPEELREFIQDKRYYTEAPDGTRFLILCDKGPEWTFQMVKGSHP